MLMLQCIFVFFFKQKTAYEMRISDWSSDVCSSDLPTIDGFVEHGIENNLHPLLLAFISNHPGCFLQSEVDIQNGNVARPSPRSLERCSETLYAQYSKVIYRDAALRGWLGDYAGGLLISDLDNEAARFDLMKLIQAE